MSSNLVAGDAEAARRLADPAEHFPYKHQAVLELVGENPPMGPSGPGDDQARAEDFMSRGIADASRNMIDAQAALLADPTEGNRGSYEQAKVALVAARQAHRANRPAAGNVVGIRARRAGE